METEMETQLTNRPAEGSLPRTAAESLAVCDKQVFHLINALLTILFTLPVSTAIIAKRSFSSLRRQ